MDLSTFEPTTLVLCLRWSGAENGLRERVFLVFFPFARSLSLSLSLSAFRPSVRPSHGGGARPCPVRLRPMQKGRRVCPWKNGSIIWVNFAKQPLRPLLTMDLT